MFPQTLRSAGADRYRSDMNEKNRSGFKVCKSLIPVRFWFKPDFILRLHDPTRPSKSTPFHRYADDSQLIVRLTLWDVGALVDIKLYGDALCRRRFVVYVRLQ